MALDPSLYATFKTAIETETDATLVAARNAGDAGAMAAWYNEARSPNYFVFRKMVTDAEIRDAIVISELEGITTAKRDSCLAILDVRGTNGYNGEVQDDRDAWDAVFSAAPGAQSQAAIAALWTKLATRAEHVFRNSTGTGADAANADTVAHQGLVTHQDVSNSINNG